MLGHRDPGHLAPGGEGDQGLAVLLVQGVEQGPTSRVGERPEHGLHTTRLGNQMVSCQGTRRTSAPVRGCGPGCSGLLGERHRAVGSGGVLDDAGRGLADPGPLVLRGDPQKPR